MIQEISQNLNDSVEGLLGDLDNLRPKMKTPTRGLKTKKRKIQKMVSKAPKKPKMSPKEFLEQEAYEGK